MKAALAMLTLFAATADIRAEDVFAEMIRSTPWLSPDDERKSFTVPEGFEIQLVAAEPDIGKPISMSFDAAGRLWVAETSNYPIESATDKTPRDRIRILSDFNADGRAGKNQVFADGLIMPDAVAPYKNGAIIFTIPNSVRLQDTDGDGTADRRDVVLGPFATRDHHNLANNFRRGFDGWMYGGQGVANDSIMKGSDGKPFQMSGGTFRFRPDGSSIQKFGDGQANVFGLCFDPLGNLFTSDCHSMPIYQNIYGGFYPVLGKPPDGLGYAPQMLTHNHGSTAISGLITCEEPLWPAEYQGNFLLGNVVTSRVNRDRVEEHGSTRLAVEMPDLVISKDPWFRPVDVQFGPDGALYIADFYNRIIAHVEVPLNHPGRDRNSARIWRVVRVDAEGKPVLRKRPDFASLGVAEKVSRLGDPSLAHRLAVLNSLADQGGEDVIKAVRSAAQSPHADLNLRAGALWILERLGVLTNIELASAAVDPDRLLRTHAMRILVERPTWQPGELELIYNGLKDKEGCVARAAADALARHASTAHITALLALRQRAPDDDTHLVYQVRKALRDQLLLPQGFAFIDQLKMSDADAHAIADVTLGLPTAGAASFFVKYLSKFPVDGKPNQQWVKHIARYGEVAAMDALAGFLEGDSSYDLDTQVNLFQAMSQGMEERGMKPSDQMKSWAGQLAGHMLLPTNPPNPARQKTAAAIAAKLELRGLEKSLVELATRSTGDIEVKSACIRALLALNAPAHLTEAESLLNDPRIPIESRGELVQSLALINTGESRNMLINSLRVAPERFALIIASALCGSAGGADLLMKAVADGQAPASLLAQRTVKDKLLAVRPELASRLAELTEKLRTNDERLQKIARERQAAFPNSGASVEKGAGVFQINCAVCHSIGSKGGRVGPELDGIGHRGLERLCEDVLDPNRNVDRVFRYSIFTLKDGSALTGLFRREEGAQIIFVDAAGKEVSVEKTRIAERTESATSLMPEVFADTLSPVDFQNLMAFLLSQATTAK